MGVLETIKDAVKLAQKLGNVEIAQALIDAQQAALDLMGENQSLRDEVARLNEALELQGTVKYDDGAYWTENGDRDGPFCTKCWDVDQKLVRMKHTHTEWFHCPNCETRCEIPSGPGATPSPPPQQPPDFYS